MENRMPTHYKSLEEELSPFPAAELSSVRRQATDRLRDNTAVAMRSMTTASGNTVSVPQDYTPSDTFGDQTPQTPQMPTETELYGRLADMQQRNAPPPQQAPHQAATPPPPQITPQDVREIARMEQETPDRKFISAGTRTYSDVASATKGIENKPDADHREALEKVGRAMAGDSTAELSNLDISRAMQAMEATGIDLNKTRSFRNAAEERTVKRYQELRRQQASGARTAAALAKDIPAQEGMTQAEWMDAFESEVSQLPPSQRAAAREQASRNIPEEVRRTEHLRLEEDTAEARVGGQLAARQEFEQEAEQSAYEKNVATLNKIAPAGMRFDPSVPLSELPDDQAAFYNEALVSGAAPWTQKGGSVEYNLFKAPRAAGPTYSVGGVQMSEAQVNATAAAADSPVFRRVVEDSRNIGEWLPSTYEGTVVSIEEVDGNIAGRIMTEARELMQENEDMGLESAVLTSAGNAIDRSGGEIAASPEDLLGALRGGREGLIAENERYITETRQRADDARITMTDIRLGDVTQAEINDFATAAVALVETGAMDAAEASRNTVGSSLREEGHAPAGANFQEVVGRVTRSLVSKLEDRDSERLKGARTVASEVSTLNPMMPAATVEQIARISAAAPNLKDNQGNHIRVLRPEDTGTMTSIMAIPDETLRQEFLNRIPQMPGNVYGTAKVSPAAALKAQGYHNVDTPPLIAKLAPEDRGPMQRLYATLDPERDQLAYAMFHVPVTTAARLLSEGEQQFEVNVNTAVRYAMSLGEEMNIGSFAEGWAGGGKRGMRFPKEMEDAIEQGFLTPSLRKGLESKNPESREFAIMQAVAARVGLHVGHLEFAEREAQHLYRSDMPQALQGSDVPESVMDFSMMAWAEGRKLLTSTDPDAENMLAELVGRAKDVRTSFRTGSGPSVRALRDLGYKNTGGKYVDGAGREVSPMQVLAHLDRTIRELAPDDATDAEETRLVQAAPYGPF